MRRILYKLLGIDWLVKDLRGFQDEKYKMYKLIETTKEDNILTQSMIITDLRKLQDQVQSRLKWLDIINSVPDIQEAKKSSNKNK